MKFTQRHLLNMKRGHWSRTGSYSPPRNRVTKNCLICGRLYERPASIMEKSKTCSNICRYKYQSLVAKPQKMTDELRKKISETKRKKGDGIGEKNANWFGGITKPIAQGRSTYKFTEWREAVLKRDGYKCRFCDETKKLEAHHLIHWLKRKDLRYDVDNGITVCKLHHKQIENHGRPRTNSKCEHMG
jgi:hypothetical protein